jgi:hypothetical protein
MFSLSLSLYIYIYRLQPLFLTPPLPPLSLFQILFFSMKAIETFSYEKYSKEDPDALPFIQDAVIDSKEVDNQLTLFTCVRGQELCVIETMLMVSKE